MSISRLFKSLWTNNHGISVVEYTLMLAFLVIGILAVDVSLDEAAAPKCNHSAAALQQAGDG